MRIFISYASEDRAVAEQACLALISAGHKVFFDKNSLPPGGDYTARIRSAVKASDLLVFLISPNSVASDAYTLTELHIAQQKWNHPKYGVLPAIVSPTAFDSIPNYLKAVTILEPSGNIPAEIANAVEIRRQGKKNIQRIGIAAAAAAAAATIIAALALRDGPIPPKPSCEINRELQVDIIFGSPVDKARGLLKSLEGRGVHVDRYVQSDFAEDRSAGPPGTARILYPECLKYNDEKITKVEGLVKAQGFDPSEVTVKPFDDDSWSKTIEVQLF